MTDAPLKLFNSLTRSLEVFEPVHPGEARVYSCGPTVYNYPHIGNMRAYVFADVLGRTLSWKGLKLTHVINITDVGHLTDDADAGEDKMEKMAAERAQSIWDIAEHYKQAYWADVRALNIRQPAQWTVATDYVPQMIEFAKGIAENHCYELESGLYFDVSTVADYGRLAREDDLMAELQAISHVRNQFVHQSGGQLTVDFLREHASRTRATIQRFYDRKSLQKYKDLLNIWMPTEAKDDAVFLAEFFKAVDLMKDRLRQGRIETVDGKKNDEDFAIWRKTPPGETRQMEWDSPWGKGAPGWHLECSVMSGEVLGFPFDIHTGGIDHREIHHPNEIAQNQAFCCTNGLDDPRNSGAKIWMHNNFLVERSGKMSKSSGEFLRLQLLIDRGYHPLAYRLMCLQAHYRSELEFSWEGLGAALTRLKRMVIQIEKLKERAAAGQGGKFDVQKYLSAFDEAISADLNTPEALAVLELVLGVKAIPPADALSVIEKIDSVLGLDLLSVTRDDLRIQPKDRMHIDAKFIDDRLGHRRQLRSLGQYEEADEVRDELNRDGILIMDGDPLGWEWRLS